mmetsp:Transcript_3960/g.13269  ORF Transcript_3960/g.13269 Transcript_3960/m.13269 type:complete len:380 (+) Transcript_3960:323-1462(+)
MQGGGPRLLQGARGEPKHLPHRRGPRILRGGLCVPRVHPRQAVQRQGGVRGPALHHRAPGLRLGVPVPVRRLCQVGQGRQEGRDRFHGRPGGRRGALAGAPGRDPRGQRRKEGHALHGGHADLRGHLAAPRLPRQARGGGAPRGDGGRLQEARLRHLRHAQHAGLQPVPRHVPGHLPAHLLPQRRVPPGHPPGAQLQRVQGTGRRGVHLRRGPQRGDLLPRPGPRRATRLHAPLLPRAQPQRGLVHQQARAPPQGPGPAPRRGPHHRGRGHPHAGQGRRQDDLLHVHGRRPADARAQGLAHRPHHGDAPRQRGAEVAADAREREGGMPSEPPGHAGHRLCCDGWHRAYPAPVALRARCEVRYSWALGPRLAVARRLAPC